MRDSLLSRLSDRINPAAARVALRAAIFMPVCFLLATLFLSGSARPFASFGAFILLAMVTFAGRPLPRLIAWATLRSRPTSRWERYQPDYGRLRGWLSDHGSEAAEAGQRAVKMGSNWLGARRETAEDYADRAGDYAALARDYADRGGRMLVKRAEREPMAALVGLGLAVYVIGSLLTSAASAREEPASPPPRKRTARR